MADSRREFLGRAAAIISIASLGRIEVNQTPNRVPAGSPLTFGAAPAVGPEVSDTIIAEAEKLVQVAPRKFSLRF